MLTIPFKNTFFLLGEDFYNKEKLSPVRNPQKIIFNSQLAKELGFSLDNSQQVLAVFAGNKIPEGAQPLAAAYSGHQFGGFNPSLGDGRALLLGEVQKANGDYASIQLKGSGTTRFSRSGDGRSALGPVLREYLLSEFMHRIGIPSTRALAAVTTGEQVVRDKMLPGGILTRVASSYIRVGSFQYFAHRQNIPAIKKLADYVINYNYPSLVTLNVENQYLKLFEQIVARQASLIAKWMSVGFIHGVMNTDNMSVAGETIDYGPCAFMDYFQKDKVYSSIDSYERYAYNQQAPMAKWNLTRLAESLLPLFDENTEQAVELAKIALNKFDSIYDTFYLEEMRAKFGLESVEPQDENLIEDYFNLLDESNADFTLSFCQLSKLNKAPDNLDVNFLELFQNTQDIKTWLAKWRERLAQEKNTNELRKVKMQLANPALIPRNHLVEKAIRAAEDSNDFSVFDELHVVLQNPYTLQSGMSGYEKPPKSDEEVRQTFCGT